MSRKHLLMISAVVVGLGAPVAWAKVPADQVARLGKDLTPMGAETSSWALTVSLPAPVPPMWGARTFIAGQRALSFGPWLHRRRKMRTDSDPA